MGLWITHGKIAGDGWTLIHVFYANIGGLQVCFEDERALVQTLQVPAQGRLEAESKLDHPGHSITRYSVFLRCALS